MGRPTAPTPATAVASLAADVRELLHAFDWLDEVLAWLFGYPLLTAQLVVLTLMAWGGLGKELGLPRLFWDQDNLPYQFLNGLAVGALFGEILFLRYLLDHRRGHFFALPLSLFPRTQPAVERLGQYLLPFWGTSLLLVALPQLFTEDYRAHPFPAWPLVLGLIASVALAVGGIYACHWRHLRRPPITEATAHAPLHRLATGFFAVAGTGLVLVWVLTAGFDWELPPIVTLCLILGVADAVFGFVEFRMRGSQHLILVLMVAGGLWANHGRPYKLRFPGLDYDHPVLLYRDEVHDFYRVLAERNDNAITGQIAAAEPLRAMCERWRRDHPERKDAKPRLVLISVSGGGIRAAVWTATVLEGLECELPLLRDRIRMFTGASGGMVGAALYAADFERQPKATKLSQQLAADSLSPTFQTMLLHDLLALWRPGPIGDDRGRSLERTWAAHTRRSDGTSPYERTFADLAPLERTGQRPSLVFCPMLVEDARRLIISNLDLSMLTEAHAARLATETATTGEYERLLSLSAVEFRRLFPKANEFRVGTAARMNATFPFVSPAVSLPTDPPRRVVDAGYYDNYGVNVATTWLLKHQPEIRAYTSGVCLIEIRAYRSGFERRYFQPAGMEDAQPDGPFDATQAPRHSRDFVTDSLTFLSSPMEALLSSWTRRTYYDDDLFLEAADTVFNGRRPAGDPFFTTVAFECSRDAALSWKLTERERQNVAESFYEDESAGVLSPQVDRQVERLRLWLGPYGDGPAGGSIREPMRFNRTGQKGR